MSEAAVAAGARSLRRRGAASSLLLGVALALTAIAAGAQPSAAGAPDTGATSAGAAPLPSGEARRNLEYALDLMQEHSINRRSIEWSAFRAAVLERARGARTAADTHDALRFALRALGDGHSFLRSGPRSRAFESSMAEDTRPRRPRAPQGTLLEASIGYLHLPGFFRGGHEQQRAYAERLHELIAELDDLGACRWIVDLRENAGGNLWPMLAGIGPVLGDGEAGAAVYPDGRRVPFWYREGKAGFGEYVQLRVMREPHGLPEAYPPAAVLTGSATASSGEAMAAAFRGRPNARSFGTETRGVSTGTRTFALMDDAAMVLTVATTADRAGTAYGGVMTPDQSVEPGAADEPLAEQPAVRAAAAWLRGQSCMR